MESSSPASRIAPRWRLILAACLLVSFACLAYPLYVIRPFRHQGTRELAAALWLTRWRVWPTVLCSLAAVAAALSAWRREPRRWPKVAASAGALAVLAFTALCSFNIYEWMFHPLDRPSFSPAAQSKLNGDEMVLAVRFGSQARAYPVRVMSYHHIVNDTLGGVPIAATY